MGLVQAYSLVFVSILNHEGTKKHESIVTLCRLKLHLNLIFVCHHAVINRHYLLEDGTHHTI